MDKTELTRAVEQAETEAALRAEFDRLRLRALRQGICPKCGAEAQAFKRTLWDYVAAFDHTRLHCSGCGAEYVIYQGYEDPFAIEVK